MSLKVNKFTTLTGTLEAGGTSATLTSAVFDNGVQVPLVVDYDNSSKLEVIYATITGTALTNIIRGKDGSSDIEHTGTPKIGLVSTPSTWDYQVSLSGGWIPAFETWTYVAAYDAGASNKYKINTSNANATSKYSIGDKVRLKQGGEYIYGYVYDVSTTFIYIITGTTYTITNTAITNNDYSKSSNPVGHPINLDWVPTYGASGSMTFGTVTTNYAKFWIVGKNLSYKITATGTTGGTASNTLTFTLPAAAVSIAAADANISARVTDTAGNSGFSYAGSTTVMSVRKYDASNFGLGTGRVIYANGTYEI